jgi:hypothetical protein
LSRRYRMAVDPGGAGGVYKRLGPKKKKKRKKRKDRPSIAEKWRRRKQGLSIEEKYRRRRRETARQRGSRAKGHSGGGGGGGGYRPTPPAKPPKPPAWWGEEWFGEGREVEVEGLGTVNLRDMQHFQNIDPLWRSWLEGLVQQAGAQGWWKNQQQSPLRWMAPVWSQM